MEKIEKMLQGVLAKRKRKKPLGLIAAVLIGAFLLTYNYSAIAYYARQLVGFDVVMSDTLRDLNELGKGQEIGKNFVFPNGVEVILDGVMLDDKHLVVFYTVNDTQGRLFDEIMPLSTSIRGGIFGRRLEGGASGRAGVIDEGRQVKGIVNFASSPGIFNRQLSFYFGFHNDRGIKEEGVIRFTLDRRKAMKSIIEQKIDQTIEVDNSIIRFYSITATPISTIIEGSVTAKSDLLLPMISDERDGFRPVIGIELLTDGERIFKGGASFRGRSGNADRRTFRGRFDALTQEFERLEIKLTELTNRAEVDKSIKIGLDTKDMVFQIKEQDIKIRKVTSKGKSTYITILTKETTALGEIYLIVDGEKVPLEEIMQWPRDFYKIEAGVITHERVFRFAATGEDLKLKIARIAYTEKYNEIINILLE